MDHFLTEGETPREIDPTKMTSVEAAMAMIDAEEAEKHELNLDALQRSHLTRMMGFPFRVKFAPNKMHVSSKREPYVTTWTKLNPGDINEHGQLLNEATVDRLVDACLRLKTKYYKEVNDAKVRNNH